MQSGSAAAILVVFQVRGQREFSISGILDESQLHFSRSSMRNVVLKSRSRLEMRVTIFSLVLVSKCNYRAALKETI